MKRVFVGLILSSALALPALAALKQGAGPTFLHIAERISPGPGVYAHFMECA